MILRLYAIVTHVEAGSYSYLLAVFGGLAIRYQASTISAGPLARRLFVAVGPVRASDMQLLLARRATNYYFFFFFFFFFFFLIMFCM